ncbi:hypothetical protein BDQ17DRAFT_1356082 [Cyathus striatus]|nr:hypothetical protein BDQ17DRAFT_1356082 [Cyathus striatus]
MVPLVLFPWNWHAHYLPQVIVLVLLSVRPLVNNASTPNGCDCDHHFPTIITATRGMLRVNLLSMVHPHGGMNFSNNFSQDELCMLWHHEIRPVSSSTIDHSSCKHCESYSGVLTSHAVPILLESLLDIES